MPSAKVMHLQDELATARIALSRTPRNSPLFPATERKFDQLREQLRHAHQEDEAQSGIVDIDSDILDVELTEFTPSNR